MDTITNDHTLQLNTMWMLKFVRKYKSVERVWMLDFIVSSVRSFISAVNHTALIVDPMMTENKYLLGFYMQYDRSHCAIFDGW